MTARELPMDSIRFWRGEFRAAHGEYLRTRDSRWRSVAQNCIWRLKQVRRENPRKRVRHAS